MTLSLPISRAARADRSLKSYYEHVTCVGNSTNAQGQGAGDSGIVWAGTTLQTVAWQEQERTQKAGGKLKANPSTEPARKQSIK